MYCFGILSKHSILSCISDDLNVAVDPVCSEASLPVHHNVHNCLLQVRIVDPDRLTQQLLVLGGIVESAFFQDDDKSRPVFSCRRVKHLDAYVVQFHGEQNVPESGESWHEQASIYARARAFDQEVRRHLQVGHFARESMVARHGREVISASHFSNALRAKVVLNRDTGTK